MVEFMNISISFDQKVKYIFGMKNLRPLMLHRLIKLILVDSVYTDCFSVFNQWAKEFSREQTAITLNEFCTYKMLDYIEAEERNSPVSVQAAPKASEDKVWRIYRNHKIFNAITRIWEAETLGMELTLTQKEDFSTLKSLHLKETATVRYVQFNQHLFNRAHMLDFFNSERETLP